MTGPGATRRAARDGAADDPGRRPAPAPASGTTGGPPGGQDGVAWRRAGELGLRVGGTAIGVGLGVVTAVYEGFLTPLRWGGVRVPLAPVLALLVNPLLVWFTYRVTGSRRLALLPGLAWCLLLVVSDFGTSEGDILLASNNWMALVLMVVGALSWATAAYLLVTRPPLSSPVPGPPAAGPRSGRRPG